MDFNVHFPNNIEICCTHKCVYRALCVSFTFKCLGLNEVVADKVGQLYSC